MKWLLVLVSALLLFGCKTYKRNSFSSFDFYGKNKVLNKISDFDVYLHQGDSVYVVKKLSVKDSVKIVGNLVLLNEYKTKKQIKIDTTEKVLLNERNDIHIHLSEEQTVIKAESNGVVKERVEIGESDVKLVRMSTYENNSIGTLFLSMIVVIILVFTGVFIFLAYLLMSLLSDISGGCYIATMVYGSYEAPKVLILRKFRDRFLNKFLVGRGFIIFYYAVSPRFVEKHQSKKWLTKIIKVVLNGFVFIISPFYKD